MGLIRIDPVVKSSLWLFLAALGLLALAVILSGRER